MELVHAHIARYPAPLDESDENIPRPLADIVAKLMAKNAEDRYQSAFGLKADLEECLRQWKATRRIDPFPIGGADLPDRFQLSQKLYGRDREVGSLLAAFERVGQGAGELMLIAGDAGIGKSVLVQEMYKPITRQRGYFISGKFDLLQRNLPHASLVQALQSLVRQILSESQTQIAEWRWKIMDAVGLNASIIVDLIPEVEQIIGAQPPPPELSSAEAQNRLNLVIERFIGVFAAPEHPLVIFLDDLQWADTASLKLIEFLMNSSENTPLLLIGAYRDNEVGPAHPLMLTIEELERSHCRVDRITLTPLELDDVTRLVVDTLRSSNDVAAPLAELIITKTNGNPFFMSEFLKSLYAEGLIAFEHQHGRWQWDLARIRAREMTDNVVTLMSDKVRSLNERTQHLLRLAACIGNRFDLQTLSIVYDESPRQTAIDLHEALAEAMVVPLGDSYKVMELDIVDLADSVAAEYRFAHDRIQQAAYSLIPDESRQTVHLQVGRLLKNSISAERQEQEIFDIVNHLNLGRELIERAEERYELAEWNLKAGRRAKTAAAYHPAYDYLHTGLELLEKNCWEHHYDLTLALSMEAAEAAYLDGEFARMEDLIGTVLERAKSLLDKVQVYEIQLLAYHNQHRHAPAIDVGLKILELLEITLPAHPEQQEIFAAFGEVAAVLEGRQVEDLLDLPEMTDPHIQAAVRILARLYSPAYVGNPNLYPIIVCKIVALSVSHGSTLFSPRAYAAYAMILCGVTGDIDTGYRFGTLALDLAERFKVRGAQAEALFLVNAFVRSWKDHIGDTLKPLLDAYQISLENGNLEFAALAAFDYGFQAYWSGVDLRRLEVEMVKFSDGINQIKQGHAFHLNELYRQAVLNLTGKCEDPCRLVGESYNEEEMLPPLLEARDINALCQVYLNKSLLCYLFGDFRQAAEHAATAEEYVAGVMATTAVPACCFYDALARLAGYPDAPEEARGAILEKVDAAIDKMKHWADHAPMNYRHKWHLMQAERAAAVGDHTAARDHYDRAIDLAREHGYTNEEALASELAFRFLLSCGQQRIARYYLRDAHYAYRQWGATGKVKDLEERYPQYLRDEQANALDLSRTASATTTTGAHVSSSLDIASIFKASQAISGEIMLDRLLARLTRIAIENAGAQRGCLILEQQGEWAIEAAIDDEEIAVMQSLPLDTTRDGIPLLPLAVVHYVAHTQEAIVLNDARDAGEFASDRYIVSVQPKSVLCVPLINQGKLHGIIYLENNLSTGAFTADRLEFLNLLSAQAAISIENARLYSNITALNRAYERFVPRQFLSYLNKESIVDVRLGDQVQKEMTIMFSDIRNFTSIAELMTPEEIFRLLNDYFSRMEPLILERHGFIDKYIGDSIMSLFPTNADDAVRASVAMIRELSGFNRSYQQNGRSALTIGIGLHTGMSMLGTVGGKDRMDGTVISDAVNIASRVEGLTKQYGVPLLVTEGTYRRLQDPSDYLIREIDRVKVKGKSEPITLYEVFEADSTAIIDLKLSAMTDFGEALALYRQQELDSSRRLFEQVWKRNPDDMAALLFLKRCDQLRQYGLPAEWDGVEVLSEK
jgi:predicted ATPase/class 3 adenylate cyclase